MYNYMYNIYIYIYIYIYAINTIQLLNLLKKSIQLKHSVRLLTLAKGFTSYSIFRIINAKQIFAIFTFAIFLLEILCSFIVLGKWLSTKQRNRFATLVTYIYWTVDALFKLYYDQIILWFLFRFVVWLCFL